MSFNLKSNIASTESAFHHSSNSYSPAPFPPLSQATKPNLTTAELAYYLDRKPQTLRGWACNENGPIRPTRIRSILAWSTAEAKKLAGVADLLVSINMKKFY